MGKQKLKNCCRCNKLAPNGERYCGSCRRVIKSQMVRSGYLQEIPKDERK